MKNKGFTLIEVVITLAIISLVMVVIVFPNIMEILDTVDNEVYYNYEKSIEKAAEDYFKVNSHELPSIGSSKTITLKTLIEANILKKIVDPKTKTECSETGTKITVTKLSEYQVNFEVKLDCGESYVSKVPTKDGLLVSLDGHIAPTNINGNYYWLDKSGNNNNAKLVNMALNDLSGYNSEKKGYQLDGIDDYFIIPHHPDLMLTNALTLEIVIDKPDTTLGGLIKKYQANTGLRGYVLEYNFNSLRYILGLPDGNSTVSITDSIKTGKQHILARLKDGKMALFVNGKKYSEKSFTQSIPTNTLEVAIGRDMSNHYLKGTIHSVRIYNRGLTDEEVINNYLAEKVKYNLPN